MKEKTKAFMAGFWDAEGCFSISKVKYPRPRVILGNKSRAAMDFIVSHFGGQYVRCKNYERHHEWYNWYLDPPKAVRSFVLSIYDDLRLKKPQADVILALCNEIISGTATPESRMAHYKAIKEMKKLYGSVTTETQNADLSSKKVAAYLTGVFDGEGSISGSYCPATKGCSMQAHLSMEAPSVVNLFKDVYGGNVRPDRKYFHWTLCGKEKLERFFLASLPYTVVKREQALVGLEFVRLPRHLHDSNLRRDMIAKLRSLKKSVMIQSELHGDMQSEPVGMLAS